MKKKAIEKIPFLTLPKTSRKKDVIYIAVTALKTVAEEQHLFVEVYRNKKQDKDIPVVRIVITKNDFGNYFPEHGVWTREKISQDQYVRNRLIWDESNGRSKIWDQTAKENILLNEADFDRIKKVCDENVWKDSKWWEYIYRKEDFIVIKARRLAESRRYERRKQALKEREENTPELPEKMILDKAEHIYFAEKHFLYYKKRGCWADITCSKCGGVTTGRWKVGISYESLYQKWIEEPREGQEGTCPLCGADGEYKCQGKVKGRHVKTIHLFLGQKYKETGMVMRYIEVTKSWNLELMRGEKEYRMHGANEEISEVEIARAYFFPGEKVQVDYHKNNPYIGMIVIYLDWPTSQSRRQQSFRRPI